jgi:hypothetical protein
MSSERRRHPRGPVMREISIVLSPTEEIPCMLVDLSRSGAKLLLKQERQLPKRFVLDMSGNIPIRRICELVWQEGASVGVAFPLLDSAQAAQFGLK